jgi:hypothetical protein
MIANLSLIASLYNSLPSLCKCPEPAGSSTGNTTVSATGDLPRHEETPKEIVANVPVSGIIMASGRNNTPNFILTPPRGMTLTMNAAKTVLVIDDETATLTMFRLFLNAYKKTNRCSRAHFAHGTKNKLAVSNPDQYKMLSNTT